MCVFVCLGEGGAAAGGAGGSGAAGGGGAGRAPAFNEFGVDPNVDPELYAVESPFSNSLVIYLVMMCSWSWSQLSILLPLPRSDSSPCACVLIWNGCL